MKRALAVLTMILAAAAAAGALAAAPRQAPAIAGTDPVTGKHVSLVSYRGRAVVINIWASWCEGCRTEAKALREFASAHPKVQLLGIDYQDTRTGAKAFYDRHDLDWPSVFDPKGRWVAALKAPGLPTTVFLNARHEIVGGIVGAGTRAQFEATLRKALASK